MQRDLFGRLLGISMTNKVDIEKQFKSPGIDIIFDQHFTPSIKDCERLRRNETTSTVSIGPNQIRHYNFAASGWIVNDDKYDFVWFVGKQFPSSVADIVIKKPTLLEIQNTKQDDDYDDIDNNGSSDNDDDYEDASVFVTLLRNENTYFMEK
ncbi:hypothetical protein TNCV_554451 [Trichonephila clavipes]|nr:hypothetical protein TNCV_554451 [Trichonephila clavipes]